MKKSEINILALPVHFEFDGRQIERLEIFSVHQLRNEKKAKLKATKKAKYAF